MKLLHCHYWISLALALALVPVLLRLHLPVNFDWITLGVAYWLVLAAQSIAVAALLYVVSLPLRDGVGPLVGQYRRNPIRILILLLFFFILGWASGWIKAAFLTVDAVAILEYRDRRNSLRVAASSVFPPALYLFATFLLIFAYNDIVASVRYNFAYDATFSAMDRAILHGHSVSDLSHWAIRVFPISFFHFLEAIYFGMFLQIGAGIILLSLCEGRARGLQFVGTILTAYYLALLLFWVWPSQGPYVLCPDHFSRFPSSLQAYNIQKALMAHAVMLWNHVPIRRISTDYFIAFPCMHIAQPVIVLWFLRRWKRAFVMLCIYDVILIAAILFLEWHYVLDIIAGVLVGTISVAVTNNWASRSMGSGKVSEMQQRRGAPSV